MLFICEPFGIINLIVHPNSANNYLILDAIHQLNFHSTIKPSIFNKNLKLKEKLVISLNQITL